MPSRSDTQSRGRSRPDVPFGPADVGMIASMAVGVVREWHDLDGWGVVDSDETPGGCWAHVSHLRMAGEARAEAGQRVTFTFEVGPQDGFGYRALDVSIDGVPRVDPIEVQPPSGGYQSRLTIDWE